MTNETEKKTARGYIILSVALLIVAIFLSAEVFYLKTKTDTRSVSADAGSTEAIPVADVIPLIPQTVVVQKKYIGYVTPVHSVAVLPFINGFVRQVHVRNGQFVKAGDLLVTLEQGTYKAALDVAEANVMQATAAFDNATTYFQRIQAAGPQAVAQTDRDTAQASYLTAKAALASANANYAAAKVDYDYTLIRAPISGLVGTVEPTKGDYVSPAGAVLMKIIQISPIEVVFSMTDKDYLNNVTQNGFSNLLDGEQIKIQLANGEIYPFTGVYLYADNTLNRATNSVAVYAGFENPQNVLLTNAYVNVFLERTLKNVVLIPQTNVSITPEGNFVTVADNKKIYSTRIKILDSQDKNYVVENNFSTGDYLVSGKPPVLKNGQPFRLNILSENGG